MAAVQTWSNVKTAQSALPSVNVSGFTTPDTFGASFAKPIEQVGNILEKKYDEESQLRAREALIRYRKELDDLELDYNQNNRGSKALSGIDVYTKRLEEVNKKYRDELSGNTKALQYFDLPAQSDANQFTTKLNAFSIAEHDKYGEEIDKAALQDTANRAAFAIARGEDPSRFTPDILNINRSMLARRGLVQSFRPGVDKMDADYKPSALEIKAVDTSMDAVRKNAFEYALAENQANGVALGEKILPTVKDPKIAEDIRSKMRAVKIQGNIIGAADYAMSEAYKARTIIKKKDPVTGEIKEEDAYNQNYDHMEYVGLAAIDNLVRGGKITHEDGVKAKTDFREQIRGIEKQVKEQESITVENEARVLVDIIGSSRREVRDENGNVDTAQTSLLQQKAANDYNLWTARKLTLPTKVQQDLDEYEARLRGKFNPDYTLYNQLIRMPASELATVNINNFDRLRMGSPAAAEVDKLLQSVRDGSFDEHQHNRTIRFVDNIVDRAMLNNGRKKDKNGVYNDSDAATASRMRAIVARHVNKNRKDDPANAFEAKSEAYLNIANSAYNDTTPLAVERNSPYDMNNSDANVLSFDKSDSDTTESVKILKKWVTDRATTYTIPITQNEPYTMAIRALGTQAGLGTFDKFEQDKMRLRLKQESPQAGSEDIENALIDGLLIRMKENKNATRKSNSQIFREKYANDWVQQNRDFGFVPLEFRNNL